MKGEMFNKPWMEACNPDLIVRFWRHKERPGKLNVKIHGVKLTFINTVFGEICVKGLSEKPKEYQVGSGSYRDEKRKALEQHAVDMQRAIINRFSVR